MDPNELKRVIEALIFAADAPLVPERIRETLEACSDEEIAQVVEVLNGEYEAAGHAFMIRAVAGGYQVTTRPQFSNWIKKLYLGRQKGRLSQAALESLAIIAFKQPISRVDIAQIRGVNSDGVIGTLLERKLITISGRSDGVGRPLLYSTTAEFLEFFGINDLTELPKPREIEELIGKEGMSEEVLQALSSDKQLKLPISFDPEAEGSETAQFESGIATLSPEQIVEAVSLKTHEAAVDEAAVNQAAIADTAPRHDEAELPSTTEEVAPAAALENEFAVSGHDPIETKNTEEPHEHPVANETAFVAVDEEAQSAAADQLPASPAEFGSREFQTETQDETVGAEPQPEMPPVLPLSGGKKRKRGKRGAAEDEQRDGREQTLVPTQEAVLPEVAENLSPEAAAEEMSQPELPHDDREEKSVSELSAVAREESEVDRVAIVEAELDEKVDELSLAADAREATIVAAREQEDPLHEEPAPAGEVVLKFDEPQVASFGENAPVQILEAPARAAVIEAESELEAGAYAEADELSANPSAAIFNDEPTSPATESSNRSAVERAAWAETESNDAAPDDAPEEVIAAAKDSEAPELDAWPEVTEVRIDEPMRLVEERAPIALSELGNEPEGETLFAVAPSDSENDLAPREEAHENARHAAASELRPAPAITALEEPMTTPNGERLHASETRETDTLRDEEKVFFV